MMNDNYILDKTGNPLPEHDLETWGKWMQTADRTVEETMVEKVLISTVFLGIDHNLSDVTSTPILFETMVFGGELDRETNRYVSRIQAVDGHAAMVNCVKQSRKAKPEPNPTENRPLNLNDCICYEAPAWSTRVLTALLSIGAILGVLWIVLLLIRAIAFFDFS